MDKAKEYVVKFSNLLVVIFFALYFFIFFPLNSGLFDTSRTSIVIIFGIFSLISISIQSVLNKKLIYTSSYYVTPALFFIFSVLISVVFSASPTYSIWGIYGFAFNSLIGIFFIFLIPVFISSLVQNAKLPNILLNIFSVVSFIVFLISLISLIGVYVKSLSMPVLQPLAFLYNFAFNLAGGLVGVQILMFASVFIYSYRFLITKDIRFKLFYGFAFLLVVLLGGMFMNIVNLLLLGFFAFLPFVLSLNKISKKEAYFPVVFVIFFIIVFTFFKFPPISKSLNFTPLNVQSNDAGVSIFWPVSTSTVGARPIFGSGVATYIYPFSIYKPQAINSTDFWDVLYFMPSKYILLVLTEIGLLGFCALIFIGYKIALNALKTKQKEFGENTYISNSSYLKFLTFFLFLVLLFTQPSVDSFVVLMLVLSLSLIYEKFSERPDVKDVELSIVTEASSSKTSSLLSNVSQVFGIYKVFVAFTFVMSICSIYFVYKIFYADFVYSSPFKKVSTVLEVRENAAKASTINPSHDFYDRTIVSYDLALLNSTLEEYNKKDQKTITEDEKKSFTDVISALVRDGSIRASRISDSPDFRINFLNLDTSSLFWQSVYPLVQSGEATALSYLNRAAGLNPLNPRIVASLGNIYFVKKEYASSTQLYQQAVLLKQDYAAARYNLAKSLEAQNNYADALAVTKTVLALVNDEKDKTVVGDYIKKLEELVKKDSNETSDVSKIQVPSDSTEVVTKQPTLTEPGEPLNSSVTGSDLPGQNAPLPGEEGFIEKNQNESVGVTPTPTANVENVNPTPDN